MTFVPSFDPCSQLPLSNLTSSAAPNSCSFLFISTPPTNRHRQVNISSIRSQNRCVNELLPYSDPLFLCRVNCVICIHHVFECVLHMLLHAYILHCEHSITMQQHNQRVLASLLPSWRPLSLHLSSASLISGHCHSGPSLGGRLNGGMDGRMDGWIGAGVKG